MANHWPCFILETLVGDCLSPFTISRYSESASSKPDSRMRLSQRRRTKSSRSMWSINSSSSCDPTSMPSKTPFNKLNNQSENDQTYDSFALIQRDGWLSRKRVNSQQKNQTLGWVYPINTSVNAGWITTKMVWVRLSNPSKDKNWIMPHPKVAVNIAYFAKCRMQQQHTYYFFLKNGEICINNKPVY